jgi:YVTN family beta-propeller protein
MKTFLWTLVWGAAAIPSLAAQQSNVWIANRFANTVTVNSTSGGTIATLSGAPFNFNQPYDVAYVPRYNAVLVSNSGSGTVTVINAQTRAFLALVSVAGVTNLRGMSVSADEEFVFAAGLAGSNATVIRIVMSSLSAAAVAGVAGTATAEDCVIIRAGAVGGTGDGPGRLYYTIPSTNTLGMIPLDPAGLVSISVLGPTHVTPTQLERSPDHGVILGGVTTSGTNTLNLLHIATATDARSFPQLDTSVMNLNSVRDVAFRDGNRAYVHASVDGLARIYEVDAQGVVDPSGTTNVGTGSPGRIRYCPMPEQLHVGVTTGTFSTYGVQPAFTRPVSFGGFQPAGSEPTAFAFTPGTGPFVGELVPTGQSVGTGSFLLVRGSGFVPGTTVQFIDQTGGPAAATPATFVSDGLLRVDTSPLAPAGPELYEVRVSNPGAQTFRMVDAFLAMGAAPTVIPESLAIPARTDGYAMRAFPQYYTAADLMDAVRTQLGGYNTSVVRIFFHQGSRYVELSELDPSDPADFSGRPFWILTRNGGALSLNRPAVGANTALGSGDAHVVVLQPGWNMVAQPHVNGANRRMSQSDVAVHQDAAQNVSAGGLPGVIAAAGLTGPVEFANRAYRVMGAAELLAAGQGYWIRNNSVAPVYLTFLRSDAVPKSAAPPAAAFLSADHPAAALPPDPPSLDMGEDSDSSGCGALGLETLLVLGFLRAVRRRRLAA